MTHVPIFLLALAGSVALAGCATYDRGGGYRYEGSDYDRRGGGPFEGPGAALLDPWLAETEEGAIIVRSGWPRERAGWIDEEVAERVNAWFRRYADYDRDMCLTDVEIRTALVAASRGGR